MIKVKKVLSGQIEENCIIIYDDITKKAIVADPGQDADKIIAEISQSNLIPEIIVNTHGHFDHIFSDDIIRQKYNIKLAISKDDVIMLSDTFLNGSALLGEGFKINEPDIILQDNQQIETSFTTFKVIHTPGHTKGSICLLFDNFLITGDTLFAGSIGRTDLPHATPKDMPKSLQKIKELNPSLAIYPGHGGITNLSNELRHNPYLK